MLNVYEELGETSRRQILGELRTGPKNVTEIVCTTGLKQPNVSNHLARMRSKTIVRAHKVGRQVYYSLASPEIEAVVNSCFAQSGNPISSFDPEAIAKQYAKAAVQGDEQACSDALDVAFRAHTPLLDIYQDILAPAMALVGTWYKVEAIDEGQEHLASSITERMMARAVQITGPTKRHNRVALLGCAPNTWHVIGLRMISDYLRLCGWKTLFLGANVPYRSFLSAVEQHRPDMVLLSVSATEGVDDALTVLRELQTLRQGGRYRFVLGVGGNIVGGNPEPFEKAGADFAATDLRSFATELLPEIERSGTVPAKSGGLA
ncbi:MAG: metalloregulator ArsR/SmtB family transcription factor [Fimbriimonas sp.]